MGLAPDVKLEDVEWRVDSKPTNGRCRYVPYIDARVAARLLDEWVGPGRWSDTYKPIMLDGKEALACSLAVEFDGQWVSKTDVGTASNTEAQKGMVSDAFKRVAIVKWGVGRNVYDLPTLWAPCNESSGKGYPNDKTKPDLLEQLRRNGFETKDLRTEQSGEVAPAGGERGGGGGEDSGSGNQRPGPAARGASTPSTPHDRAVALLVEKLNALPVESRKTVKGQLVEKHGPPTEWKPADLVAIGQAIDESPF